MSETGKVKWYNTQKGYGFIEGTDGKSYFFHHSQLPKDSEEKPIAPNQGEEVSFTPKQTDKGVQATAVKIL